MGNVKTNSGTHYGVIYGELSKLTTVHYGVIYGELLKRTTEQVT